jgi:hypothetical protein
MTKVTKRDWPLRRWFRKFTQTRTPYRWYDVEHWGM